MSQFGEWADRVLRTVEGDGAYVARVRLVTPHDGSNWATWSPPWLSAEEFDAQVQAKVRQLESEFPARQLSCLLEADAPNGEVLQRFPFRVLGKNRASNALEAGAEANAIVMDRLASTVENIMRLANTQLDEARRQLKAQNDIIHEQNEVLRAYRTNYALGDDEDRDSPVADALKEQMPALMALAQTMLEESLKRR